MYVEYLLQNYFNVKKHTKTTQTTTSIVINQQSME
jgi:hypothetical protein